MFIAALGYPKSSHERVLEVADADGVKILHEGHGREIVGLARWDGYPGIHAPPSESVVSGDVSPDPDGELFFGNLIFLLHTCEITTNNGHK